MMKNTPKLKNMSEPLNKVYINRDTHPVYLNERKRLQKKINDLRRHQNMENPENITLQKGLLKINGSIVDRNIFL